MPLRALGTFPRMTKNKKKLLALAIGVAMPLRALGTFPLLLPQQPQRDDGVAMPLRALGTFPPTSEMGSCFKRRVINSRNALTGSGDFSTVPPAIFCAVNCLVWSVHWLKTAPFMRFYSHFPPLSGRIALCEHRHRAQKGPHARKDATCPPQFWCPPPHYPLPVGGHPFHFASIVITPSTPLDARKERIRHFLAGIIIPR